MWLRFIRRELINNASVQRGDDVHISASEIVHSKCRQKYINKKTLKSSKNIKLSHQKEVQESILQQSVVTIMQINGLSLSKAGSSIMAVIYMLQTVFNTSYSVVVFVMDIHTDTVPERPRGKVQKVWLALK